jgi:glycerate kinase
VVPDPLGRPGAADYVIAGGTAVIDLSAASGLWRVEPGDRDPLRATTTGTGELLRNAERQGATSVVLALGGSATNDGGAGFAAALGWKFFDANDTPLDPRPIHLGRLARVVPPEVAFSLPVTGWCDVQNPLLGPQGATRTFSAQKGATAADQELLESALERLADCVARAVGRDCRAIPGAGAAGGAGFGVLAFLGGSLRSGFAEVARLLDLPARIVQADMVFTGEGRLDGQTAQGKAPAELARLAHRLGKPVVALVGEEAGGGADFDAVVPIPCGPLTLADCQSRAAELLERAAERAARLLKISL